MDYAKRTMQIVPLRHTPTLLSPFLSADNFCFEKLKSAKQENKTKHSGTFSGGICFNISQVPLLHCFITSFITSFGFL